MKIVNSVAFFILAISTFQGCSSSSGGGGTSNGDSPTGAFNFPPDALQGPPFEFRGFRQGSCQARFADGSEITRGTLQFSASSNEDNYAIYVLCIPAYDEIVATFGTNYPMFHVQDNQITPLQEDPEYQIFEGEIGQKGMRFHLQRYNIATQTEMMLVGDQIQIRINMQSSGQFYQSMLGTFR